MTRGRPARAVALAAAVLLTSACDVPVTGVATAASSVPDGPASPAELEALLVDSVPSGLPRLPDADVRPPAGEKSVEDVAAYADDPARERHVLLADYGYRFGWECFWGVDGGAMTSVFVHRMKNPAGAAALARDLAANDATYYAGALSDNPPDLPGGCRLLTVEHARPGSALDGPAAISWCGHGVFSVSVTAVSDSVEAAQAEVRELLPAQLDRLD